MKILVRAVGCLIVSLFAALGVQPLVAVHDSEFTRSLLTTPASGATPTTTGFQWWSTNWAYFVMPESMKELFRSDGTPFASVSDANIIAGSLIDSNGTPKYPIMFSLASEAIDNGEMNPLTNYVAKGGFLFIGSSAFCRNTNGTTRTNFALTTEMGVSMWQPSLLNWRTVTNFQKATSHRITSHIPDGLLTWIMPFAAEDIPYGIAPTNFNDPADAVNNKHQVWQVTNTTATVLANNNFGPDLMVKPFGKGFFIYYAPMQPLIGQGGEDASTYASMIFRKSIEWAFESSKLAIPRLSPWPYQFDAAIENRHDLEAIPGLINQCEASAQYENAHGLRGDYYPCTGEVQNQYTISARTAEINSLRNAVTSFGATIGSHNGGLTNASTPSVPTDYWYWHWGPDEFLSITIPGFGSGKTYAFQSISNSFLDIRGWLSGITNNARNHWVAPAYNSTREGSKEVLDSLCKTAGEEKLGPWPHWTLSTKTSGKQFSFLSIPLSDWFVNGAVSHSMEGGHTADSVPLLVDYYYSIGGLINQYAHSSSAGGAPPADAIWARNDLAQEYVDVATDTNRYPRLWSVNAEILLDWWTRRKTAGVIIPSFATNGIEYRARIIITNASDTQTAVEFWVPRPGYTNIQVFTNGVPAATNVYRTLGQLVRVQTRPTMTNAEVRFTVVPTAENAIYSFGAAGSLSVPAPGYLTNCLLGFGTNMSALLVTNPTHGTFTFNTNGSFVYTPTNGFVGIDSFTYRSVDGVSTSGVATVSLAAVSDNGPQFSDDFTRTNYPAQVLPPWSSSNTWTIVGGELRATNGPTDYAYTYIGANWTNYSVSARVRFPSGPNVPGAAIFGRLNPTNGTRYSLWIYPGNTPFGSPNILRLIKFTGWSTWSGTPMGQVDVTSVGFPAVGTNWHNLQLTFVGNQVSASYEGTTLLSATDNNFSSVAAYLTGGIGLETYKYATGFVMSADDVVVTGTNGAPPQIPQAANDSFEFLSGSNSTVVAAGVMANDVTGSGGGMTAQLVSGPAHNNGAFTLNADGSFTYQSTAGYTGSDSFTYHVFDGANTSANATATISVVAATNVVIFDNFSRGTDPAAVTTPWVTRNNWSFTAGQLQTMAATPSDYCYAYINTNLTNFSVEAPISFPSATSGGGGIGGRLNTTSGAHYSAWFYADNSPYGLTHTVELFKWSDFANETSLGFVTLPTLGTGPHVLKLTFETNLISVFVDGAFIMSNTDNTLTSGAVDVEGFEDTTHFAMNADYFLVTQKAPTTASPVAGNDSYSVNQNVTLSVPFPGVLSNDSAGTGGGALTAILNSTVTHGTLNLTNNGGFRYVPTANYTGSDSFTYHVNDGVANSGVATVTLSVNPVNTAPTLAYASNNVIVAEDRGAVSLANFASTTTGGDIGQTVTNIAILSVSNPAMFSVPPAFTAAGLLSFTAAANSNGVVTVIAQAQDNGGTGNGGTNGSLAASFTITITPVYDPPVAQPDTYQLSAGSVFVVAAPGVLSNDIAGDGGALTAQLVTGPFHNSGAFTLSSNGSFTYTPTNGFSGADSFTYQTTDGVGTSAVTTVTFNVTVGGVLFSDNFTRGTDPTFLAAPWVVSNQWTVTGGELRSAPTNVANYAFAWVATNWTDVALSARIRFPDAQSGGGGLAGRLNAATGARYALWIYPDNSPYGLKTNLRLLKFTTWDTFTELARSQLTVVGTNWHDVKIAFSGTHIGCYFDGILIHAVNDTSSPFTSGGVDTETYENTVNYPMNVDDFFVRVLAPDDSYTVNEDSILSVPRAGILTNDTGVASTNVVATLVTGPTHGSLNLTNNGGFRYVPTADYSGPDSFTYQSSDGTLILGTATVNLVVSSVNDAPTLSLVSNNVIVLEDAAPVTLTSFASATTGASPEAGQTITNYAILGVTNPGYFTAGPVISPTGTLTFTPAANSNGVATVTLQSRDDGGTANGGTNGSVAQSFTITLTAVNDAPTLSLVSNNVVVLEDAAPVSLTSFASATTGPNNESAQAISGFAVLTVSNPALFSAGPAIALNGTLSFTPALNANGSAVITVQSQDNGGTANGGTNGSLAQSITINVTAVNDAPTISLASNNVVTLEDSSAVTVPNFASATTGPANESGQTITGFAVLGVTNPGFFSVGPAISAGGTLTFTPVANSNGVATVTVQSRDDGGTANGGTNGSGQVTFTITLTAVNDAPTVSFASNNVVVLEDAAAVTVANFASGTTGPANESGQTITGYTVLSVTNAGFFMAGPVISPTGTLTFTPAANSNGVATVVVQSTDDGGTANGGTNGSTAQTFTITITAVNDAPTASFASNNVIVLEDSAPVTLPGFVSTTTGPANEASQSITGISILSVTNAGFFAAGPVISPSGTLTFTPAANSNGVATVVLQATDDGGTANGGTNGSVAQTFTITITPVNDAPTLSFASNNVVVMENSGSSTVAGFASTTTGPANESGQSITSIAVLNVVNPGMFSAGPAIGLNGTLTFTTAPNSNGVVTVTVQARDDGGTANGGTNGSAAQTFTISIGAVNDAPTLPAQTNRTIFELTTLTVTNAASDIDTPASLLTYILTGPTNAVIDTNGVITWTPDESQGPSTNTFTTVVSDGALTATNSFLVTVLETNAAPTLPLQSNVTLAEQTLLTVTNTASDTDLPANTLTYQLTGPGGAAIDLNGVITWTPNESQGPSTNTFTTVVSDGALTATNTFTVTVTEVNVAPTLSAQNDRTIAELTLLTVTNTGSDTDLPANTLTYQLTGPSGAAIDLNGVITWTPDESQGPSTNVFTTIVSDGALTATNTFTVTVTEVNVAPTLPVQNDRTIAELTLLTVTNTGSDTDLPANTLTYQLTGPTNAAIDSHGIITWTPDESQGPSTNLFTTVVSDGALTATNTFTVIVTEVNMAPTLPAQNDRTIAPQTLLLVTNTASDTDLPVNTLTYQLSGPAGASIDLNGVISWAPDNSQADSTNTFTTIVTDDGSPALSATNSFTVIVTAATTPMSITQVTVDQNVATVTWSSINGKTYRVQHCDDPQSGNWTDMVPDVTASGTTASQTDDVTGITQRYYRVLLLP